jgi:hypothetical protein
VGLHPTILAIAAVAAVIDTKPVDLGDVVTHPLIYGSSKKLAVFLGMPAPSG